MEKQNGLSFNCAESVILQVNKEQPLPDFGPPCMRIASLMGGGISGAGVVCGTVTGSVICLGLALGSNGNESPDTFKDTRKIARDITFQFLQDFGNAWGTISCSDLRAMDKGELTPSGELRVGDTSVRNRCDEYVKWASTHILGILHQDN
ncbi:MAG: C-GCAxxG-C-C family (seleno)protein [Candidatus Thorarchaeota archaeon]